MVERTSVATLDQINNLDELRAHRSELTEGIYAISNPLFEEIRGDKQSLLSRIKESEEYSTLAAGYRNLIDTCLGVGCTTLSDQTHLPATYFQNIESLLDEYKAICDIQKSLAEGMSPFRGKQGWWQSKDINSNLSQALTLAEETKYEERIKQLVTQMEEYLAADYVTFALSSLNNTLGTEPSAFGHSAEQASETLSEWIGKIKENASPKYIDVVMRVYRNTLAPKMENAFE